MKQLLAIGLAGLACVACSTTDRLGPNPFGTTNERFSIRKDPVIVTGIAATPASRAATKEATSVDLRKGAGSIQALLVDYYNLSGYAHDLEFSNGNPRHPSKTDAEYTRGLIDYRSAGFDASRAVCSYALNLLGEAHSNYKFLNRTGNVAASAGASLMGILNASARSVSVFAVGTTLYQAWSQDFEEYAYLTASIGTVGKKVLTAQDTYRDGVEGKTVASDPPLTKDQMRAPISWSDATLQIQRYNDFCLATGMRALVEEAVGKADVYFDPATRDIEFVNTGTAQVRAAVDAARLQQAVTSQITEQLRIVRASDSALARGKLLVVTANRTINDLSANKFYDATAKTVNLATAKSEADDANSRLAEKKKTVGADTTAEQAAADAANKAYTDAQTLQEALRTVGRYGSEWETAQTATKTAANQQLDALYAQAQKLAGITQATESAPTVEQPKK